MTPQGFLSLAWQSVIAPREVARLLISLQLGREPLVLLLALVMVVQTAVVLLAAQVAPPDPALAPFLTQPVIFFMGFGGILATLALALTWTGRAMGGAGRIEELGLLVIWMQALRILVQIATLALSAVAPGLAGMVSLLASAAAIWILVNFLAEAHGFAGLGKAGLVLLLAITGLALGLSFFLTLIGATTMGMNSNV